MSGLLLAPFRGPGPPLCAAAIVLAAATVSASRGWLRTGSVAIAAVFFLMGNAADVLQKTTGPALRELYRREGERAFVSPRRVEGRLRREPERARDRTLLTLDVERVAVAGQEIRVQGGLKVSVRGVHRRRLEVLEAGDRVVFWARLRLPSYFRNPGSFDGAAYLARQEIELLGSTKSALLVTLDEKGPLWSSFISRLRLRALRRLDGALSEETFGVVAALVTGERAGLSPELERLYQRAGIYHVMAISGAHVALWILFLHGLMRRCGVSASSSHLVLLILLPLYAAFCGARPPVLRAVVMASAVLGARLLSLRSPAVNGLALAALLLLIEDPSMLRDAGFQLSFAAMGTIALALGPLHSRLAFAGRLALPLAISIAAQLGVVPVAAWHFHRLSPVAPEPRRSDREPRRHARCSRRLHSRRSTRRLCGSYPRLGARRLCNDTGGRGFELHRCARRTSSGRLAARRDAVLDVGPALRVGPRARRLAFAATLRRWGLYPRRFGGVATPFVAPQRRRARNGCS